MKGTFINESTNADFRLPKKKSAKKNATHTRKKPKNKKTAVTTAEKIFQKKISVKMAEDSFSKTYYEFIYL